MISACKLETCKNESKLGSADTLEYCEGKLHDMPQFNGCGPTVKFIRVFDRLFDVLNSRNPRGNSFKVLIRKTNYEFVKKFLDNACEYIKGLKGPDGRPILKLQNAKQVF